MARLKVKLVEIRCNDTEDFTGSDDIWVLVQAAHSISDPLPPDVYEEGRLPKPPVVPVSLMPTTPPKRLAHRINNGEKWTISEDAIDIKVQPGPLRVDVWLYDQDAAEDYSVEEIEAAKAAINAAGAMLAVPTGFTSLGVAAVMTALIEVGAKAARADGDDLLGHDTFTWTVPSPQLPGAQMFFTSHARYFKANEDGADYDVFYIVELLDS